MDSDDTIPYKENWWSFVYFFFCVKRSKAYTSIVCTDCRSVQGKRNQANKMSVNILQHIDCDYRPHNLMIHEKATQPDTGQTSPKMFLKILNKSILGLFSHSKLSRPSCAGIIILDSLFFWRLKQIYTGIHKLFQIQILRPVSFNSKHKMMYPRSRFPR